MHCDDQSTLNCLAYMLYNPHHPAADLRPAPARPPWRKSECKRATQHTSLTVYGMSCMQRSSASIAKHIGFHAGRCESTLKQLINHTGDNGLRLLNYMLALKPAMLEMTTNYQDRCCCDAGCFAHEQCSMCALSYMQTPLECRTCETYQCSRYTCRKSKFNFHSDARSTSASHAQP